jgi:hypothetical protein
MAGYLKYARALTADQWQAEWQSGFIWQALERVRETFWQHELVSSIGERLCLEFPGDFDMASPILHNVSINELRCSLFISFQYGVFSQRYSHRRGSSDADEPVETSDDGEQDYYLFDVSVMLHIDDERHVSSELVDICSQSSEA